MTKCVLILGAKSDLAGALAKEYASLGYDLILAARNAEQMLAADQSDLSIRYSVNVHLSEWDVLDYSQHESYFHSLPVMPNGVVCCVGSLTDQNRLERVGDLAMAEINTNFSALALFLNVVAQSFIQRGNGFIVGVSSVAGDRGRQSNYIYGAAKAGFSAYLSGLRNRLYRHGVHVMTVKPGFMETAMTEGMDLPKVLTAQPHQVAKSIVKAQGRGRDVLYSLSIWRWIMLVIKLVPEMVFKRMSL